MADVKSCETCAYISKSENDYPCNKCTRNASDKWKQMSNADKIRAMSDEEMAKIIVTNPIFTWDKVEEDYEDVLNWLQSEAE